jgi:hypothetical protein
VAEGSGGAPADVARSGHSLKAGIAAAGFRHVGWILADLSARTEEGAKSMLGETTIIALTPAATFQPLGESEGAVVLMTDSGQLYTCNDTTVALLQALDGARSFGSIVDELLDEFDVERDVLVADLSQVVGELEREGIVAVAMGSA